MRGRFCCLSATFYLVDKSVDIVSVVVTAAANERPRKSAVIANFAVSNMGRKKCNGIRRKRSLSSSVSGGDVF